MSIVVFSYEDTVCVKAEIINPEKQRDREAD